MKNLNEMTAKGLMEHQQRIRSKPASQVGIDKIWMVMAGIFGTKWTNSMGIDPTNDNAKTWRAVLRGVSDEQIDKGLVAFSDTAAVFIPAATEFKALCKYNGMTREQAAFKKLSERRPERLLVDQGSKERTQAARDKAMKIIKG